MRPLYVQYSYLRSAVEASLDIKKDQVDPNNNQLRYVHFANTNKTFATKFIKIRDKGYGIHGVQNLVVAIDIPAMFYAVTSVR